MQLQSALLELFASARHIHHLRVDVVARVMFVLQQLLAESVKSLERLGSRVNFCAVFLKYIW